MKVVGVILVVLGSLSVIGSLTGGTNPTGPLICLAIGAYLIHLANRKKKEQKDKDDWSNR